ncbi:hypothetical protein LINPERPRIM_LOCUS5252, partial [Linum perenne]
MWKAINIKGREGINVYKFLWSIEGIDLKELLSQVIRVVSMINCRLAKNQKRKQTMRKRNQMMRKRNQIIRKINQRMREINQ